MCFECKAISLKQEEYIALETLSCLHRYAEVHLFDGLELFHFKFNVEFTEYFSDCLSLQTPVQFISHFQTF